MAVPHAYWHVGAIVFQLTVKRRYRLSGQDFQQLEYIIFLSEMMRLNDNIMCLMEKHIRNLARSDIDQSRPSIEEL